MKGCSNGYIPFQSGPSVNLPRVLGGERILLNVPKSAIQNCYTYDEIPNMSNIPFNE